MNDNAQSQQSSPFVKKKSHRKKRLVLRIITVLVLAGSAVGVWWLFNSGRLVYVSSDTKLESKSSAVVCGTKMVDTYNATASFEVRNGVSEPVIDTKALESLANQIRSTGSYETDATCQTLLFWIAFNDNDYKGALSAHAEIKSLHDKGIFADSNLRSAAPLYSFDSYIFSLSGAEANGGN